jgi:hypothetical protein
MLSDPVNVSTMMSPNSSSETRSMGSSGRRERFLRIDGAERG